MRNKILTAIIILTILTAVVLFILYQSPLIAIFIGTIACFMIYFMWSPPPPKHKNFSDRDRLEATSRAMGGSGAPPELWTPDIPEKKHHKGKK